MPDNSSNSKRIAKNTVFLYIRMLLLLFISLYTVRVILDKLGVEDYGIYNVVGGLATMFAFFSSALANGVQRFVSIELGRNDHEQAKKVFTHCLVLFLVLTLGIFVVGECVGIWFLNNKLQIPEARFEAATIVFHLSMLSACANFIGIVFNSEIIANEDMKIYSYLGIADGLFKLLIAYLIGYFPIDNLILYAALQTLVVLIIQIFYAIYCFRKYAECCIVRTLERSIFKKISSFMSWNVFGTIIYVTKDQCLNILLNMFYGPVVNASRAVALQVNGAITQFSNNIYTSVQPQIIKSYSAGNLEYMHKLFFMSSKYCALMLWLIGLPVILSINDLLGIWLKDVPDYAPLFTILVIVDSMGAVLTNAPWGATLAVGKLKWYQIFGNGALLLILPMSYLFMKLGAGPSCAFYVLIVCRIFQIIAVLIISNKLIHFSLRRYFDQVVKPLVIVLSLTLLISMLVLHFVQITGFLRILATVLVTVPITIITVYSFTLTQSEKEYATKIMYNIKSKYFIRKI